ncbi:MAG TPA: hypothetical protein VE178_10605 [Silvibacterium sp.]|jgi:hypothetical protein|nr:hypothetical protein [Silvibacterium sp.]
MSRILRSYFFWTYERGSFHYDVMVTLILAFIFLTPRIWNYGERPQEVKLAPGNVLVKTEGANDLVYEIPAAQIQPDDSLEAQIRQNVQAVSGPVVVDRYEAVKEPHGKTKFYRVWAHR